MSEEPEEGFTIRDRRRSSVEETPTPPPAPEIIAPSMSETMDAADAMEMPEGYSDEDFAPGDENALPDVYSVLALFLGELRNLAWLRMGLVANPATGQIERDLPQAKMAIDTVAYLASQLENVVLPEERLPLKALVSDLQVNFVEQSKRS